MHHYRRYTKVIIYLEHCGLVMVMVMVGYNLTDLPSQPILIFLPSPMDWQRLDLISKQ